MKNGLVSPCAFLPFSAVMCITGWKDGGTYLMGGSGVRTSRQGGKGGEGGRGKVTGGAAPASVWRRSYVGTGEQAQTHPFPPDPTT